jgi:thiol-disulfide isomerase/thioredoxin
MSETINYGRRRILSAAALAIPAIPAIAIAPIDALANNGTMPPLSGATGWLNSAPLTAANLRGKVVLVEFWTYTCINWLRQLPYVRAWAQKYRQHGLVVIGAHTPEFEFEKDLENVRRAVKEMRIAYPIAIDNDFGVWRAFRNSAWPALYFVDAQGRIRRHHIGEGDYPRSEKLIQQLLADSGVADVPRDLVSPDGRGAEAAADWANLRSPETYLGQRAQNRVNAAAARLRLNQWSAAGDWTARKEALVLPKPNGRIAYRFHARDLHLVMGPAVAGSTVRFRVVVDGKPPGAAHGVDIDEEGKGKLTEQRLYQLVRQPNPISDRQFEIEFIDTGVEAFAFTFG